MKKNQFEDLKTQANQLYERGDYFVAKEMYRQILQHFVFVKRQLEEKKIIYKRLGYCCLEVGKNIQRYEDKILNMSEAYGAFVNLYKLEENNSESIVNQIAVIIIKRSCYYLDSSNIEEGKKDFIKANKWLKKTRHIDEDVKLQLKDLTRYLASLKADEAYDNKNYEIATKLYEQAIELLTENCRLINYSDISQIKDSDLENLFILGDHYYNLAECYREMGEAHSALTYFLITFSIYDHLIKIAPDEIQSKDYQHSKDTVAAILRNWSSSKPRQNGPTSFASMSEKDEKIVFKTKEELEEMTSEALKLHLHFMKSVEDKIARELANAKQTIKSNTYQDSTHSYSSP